MKNITFVVLCFAIALAGKYGSAQQLPVAPGPQTAFLHSQDQIAIATTPGLGVSYSSSAAVPAFASAAAYSLARAAPKPRIADKKFFLVNSLHLGLAVADVELTQRCIANHTCHEGNPLMPSSHAGELSVAIGYDAFGSVTSYWFKKHKARTWWFPPAGGIVGHAVGIATGLSH
jgi:hypothetical protein